MLSKKYYQKFAALLGSSGDLREFETKLCIYFKADNERFDVVRFRKAVENFGKNRSIDVIAQ